MEKLDLVILTHFDKDHIGGFAKVADAFPMDRVLMPDYVRDSEPYAALEASLQKHAIAAERLSEDTAFELGRAA
ncbi:MAG: MBL fold metallo-hydrolase, partial [Clostridia bacterium]|nr:MBL fold metallo-hydrolase [Clostridia bacterium]